MLKAILVRENKQINQPVTLESGSLFYIDEITKKYNSIDSLKALYNSKEIGNDDNIKLYYIKDFETKEELPILINDEKPIQLYNNLYENIESEIEKSRKLLFNSKNKMFIKMFLNDKSFSETLNFSINVSFEEYKYCTKCGLSIYENNGNYYVRTLDLFKYISNSNKYGKLRGMFEDSLDLWKRRITSSDSDKIYYYSRNLRILKNKYYKKVKGIINIKNLNIRDLNIYKISSLAKNDNINQYVKIKKGV